ncbi:MAG: 1,2-phenylacetyl-CoA epoxidase subunit PaaD [Casimicrobiaceae bacterium]
MVSAEHAVAGGRPTIDALWAVLGTIPDPEIPVISVVELGIVRDLAWRGRDLVVTLTPTYSGCPATAVIVADVARALHDAGIPDVRIETRLAPAWTTDWMTPAARKRLAEYGIAPPGGRAVQSIDVAGLRGRKPPAVPCPRCGSTRTRELSRFGSTPCKAQHRCDDCLEPFDYFKPH